MAVCGMPTSNLPSAVLLPPHFLGDIDRELEFRPLLFLGEEIAFLGGSKSALRRYSKLIERREFARLFQPPLDVFLLLQFARFRGDDTDHHDLVALRQI